MIPISRADVYAQGPSKTLSGWPVSFRSRKVTSPVTDLSVHTGGYLLIRYLPINTPSYAHYMHF